MAEPVVDRCPIGDSLTMPCCGLPPGERMADRMTTDPDQVTCGNPERELASALSEVARMSAFLAKSVQHRLYASVSERAVWSHERGHHADAEFPFQFCPLCELEHPLGKLTAARQLVQLDNAGQLAHLVDEWGALGVGLKLLAGVPLEARETWLRALGSDDRLQRDDLPDWTPPVAPDPQPEAELPDAVVELNADLAAWHSATRDDAAEALGRAMEVPRPAARRDEVHAAMVRRVLGR